MWAVRVKSKLILIIFSLFFLSIGCAKDSSVSSPSSSSFKKINLDASGCYIGAFVDGVNNIANYENMMGKKLAIVMWYIDFTKDFPLADVNEVIKNGSIPCITWEPWKAGTDPAKYNYFPLKDIASGSFDSYLNSWASQVKNFKYPVLIRLGHEMNGNWYPWDGFHNGQSGSLYISAWKYIYNIFKKQGAENAYFIWNVNAASVPNENWNSVENYYPGDDFVDFLAIDGFNFGTSNAQETWKTFDSIFLSMYNTLQTLYPKKPIFIGEMACSEAGGSKSFWIDDSFVKIKSKYPNIRAYNWFNINKETDWRISSSAESQNAFKKAMEDKYFLEKVPIQ